MRSPRLGLCIVFFQKMVRMSKYHGVATSTMFSNLTMSILLHGARCIGDGYNYSGLSACVQYWFLTFFCMISSISKGGVKFHIWM